MCKTVADIVAYCRCLFSDMQWQSDLNLAPLNWNEVTYKMSLSQPMKFGYLCYRNEDGVEVDGLENLPLSTATKRIYSEAK
jgi:hypothetical protein